MMNCSLRLLSATESINNRSRVVLGVLARVIPIVLAAVLLSWSSARSFAQDPSSQQRDAITVEGTIRNSAGEPVADASVILEEKVIRVPPKQQQSN